MADLRSEPHFIEGNPVVAVQANASMRDAELRQQA
jgi:hypothetical protein